MRQSWSELRVDCADAVRRVLPASAAAAVAGLLVGCASAPEPRSPAERAPMSRSSDVAAPALAWRIVELAQRQIGAPYRYGGASPAGFDCSGLVFYTHRELGVGVARTARAQFESVAPVGREQLRVGDLVFFRFAAATVDHVGIYVGDRRFVHAPRSGQSVRVDSLQDPAFAARFVSAGRAVAD
jgi:cell wall-associated NlpC family hydrolase